MWLGQVNFVIYFNSVHLYPWNRLGKFSRVKSILVMMMLNSPLFDLPKGLLNTRMFRIKKTRALVIILIAGHIICLMYRIIFDCLSIMLYIVIL